LLVFFINIFGQKKREDKHNDVLYEVILLRINNHKYKHLTHFFSGLFWLKNKNKIRMVGSNSQPYTFIP
jgi:hypothetical protein